jgi:hypothetical protein
LASTRSSYILANYFAPLSKALYAMKYFAPFVLLIMIFGCSREAKEADRITYWKHEFSSAIQVGSTYEEIKTWSLSHQIPFEVTSSENEYALVLEVKKENSIVCVDWTYILSFQLNAKNELVTYDINRHGRCL